MRSACQSVGSSRISIWITRLGLNRTSLGEARLEFSGSAAEMLQTDSQHRK